MKMYNGNDPSVATVLGWFFIWGCIIYTILSLLSLIPHQH